MSNLGEQMVERVSKVHSQKVLKYVKEGLLPKIEQAGEGAGFWLERLENDFAKLKPEGLMKGFDDADFDDLWYVLTGEKKRAGSTRRGTRTVVAGQLMAASGQGARIDVQQVLRILKANGMNMASFATDATISDRGLVTVKTVTLGTGARLVKESSGPYPAAYYLRIDGAVPMWEQVWWQHVKEAGGLAGGYGIKKMV